MNKILLVEDDELEAKMYKRLFEAAGFEVYHLQDGEECKKAALCFHPDVILLDLIMPHVDGLQTLDALHFDDETKHIPVIMLTNLADSSIERNAIERGASLFFTKSNIENSELITHVKRMIANQS